MKAFRDRVAVVTGAASGIGAALCAELGRAGALVIATDVDGDGAARVAAAIPHARGERVDVTDAAAVDAFAASLGRIDVWINNAGIGVGGATLDLERADWDRVLAVNLDGVIHGVRAAYPRMVSQGSGQIINIASVSGIAPYPFALPYVTTKHAVVGLSLALRAEARGLGVKVNVACPGMIDTPIWQRSAVRGELAKLRTDVLLRLASRTTAQTCAEKILRGAAANRAVTTVTAEARLMWMLTRLSPDLATWVGHRIATAVRAR